MNLFVREVGRAATLQTFEIRGVGVDVTVAETLMYFVGEGAIKVVVMPTVLVDRTVAVTVVDTTMEVVDVGRVETLLVGVLHHGTENVPPFEALTGIHGKVEVSKTIVVDVAVYGRGVTKSVVVVTGVAAITVEVLLFVTVVAPGGRLYIMVLIVWVTVEVDVSVATEVLVTVALG